MFNDNRSLRRRDFLKTSGLAALSATTTVHASFTAEVPGASRGEGLGSSVGLELKLHPAKAPPDPGGAQLPVLAPAKWIWCPTTRVHENTFVLFRREVLMRGPAKRATGWIVGESRYLLEVNGRRVQWGPAPCDPRYTEADPIDITALLQPGPNVIGATVCYFGGQGDGTWPTGKPGFLFWLEIEHGDGTIEKVVSDEKWQTHLCRAWPVGHFRRHLFRALQEDFDARLYPQRWKLPGFTGGSEWRSAMALGGSPNRPAVFNEYFDIDSWIRATGDGELRPRSIPLLREIPVPVRRLAETHQVAWSVPPAEYLEHLASTQAKLRSVIKAPSSLTVFKRVGDAAVRSVAENTWEVQLDGVHSAALTFELTEQVVGFPYFTVEAGAGTVVEVLMQEGHAIGGNVLLQTGKNEWARLICREGVNSFVCFEFDTLRWLQLHVYGSKGSVKLREVGVLRRVFPWAQRPVVRTGEPGLQRLFDACLNTLNNTCQETVVDGMGRERQQYCGDVAHQLHALRLALGEFRLPARYLTTFSQGLTTSGYFLDCWPAVDRLTRAGQRHFNLFHFGTILDHGVQLFLECHHHYMQTGEREALIEPYPRMLRFVEYLATTMDRDGLLAVENLGLPFVWIDYEAYGQRSGEFPKYTQRRKQCAYNLYIAAALRHGLVPVCRVMDDARSAEIIDDFAQRLERKTIERFWDEAKGIFVDNLPWLREEGREFYCDRTLATAVLFDQCPGRNDRAAIDLLARRPPEMGLSYVANAGWRLWALAKGGRTDVVLKEFRETWAKARSVLENNGMPEGWNVKPDTGSQWSFCAVAPLYVTFQGLAGIRPLEPGYRRVEFRPQLGDLADLELVTHAPFGPIRFAASGRLGARALEIGLPAGVAGEIVVHHDEKLALPRSTGAAPAGCARYLLEPGSRTTLRLAKT